MIPRPFAFFLAASLGACGHGSSRPTDSASVSNLPVETATAAHPDTASAHSKSSPCPRTGRWALCSLEKRLQQSGFVLKRLETGTSRRPGFTVAPTAYTLGHSRLEVFVYPDEGALAKDVGGIDTLTASPRGRPSTWDAPVTFVRSANLAAVLVTDSPVQAERLTLAITAGPPQPN
ncbi:MAG TPA: hypothetical protein VGO33_11285 [Gemmatimonadaceae bacterium]|nr:hypothetical protein [Gemmatimonadaceae bacterium]